MNETWIRIRKMAMLLNCSVLPAEIIQGKEIAVLAMRDNSRAIFFDDKSESYLIYIAKALVHLKLLIDSKEVEPFTINDKTVLTNSEMSDVYELLMPKKTVLYCVDRLLIPTTLALAEIFNVPQEFVRERLRFMPSLKFIAGYDY